jgi:hypothetical protein
MAENKTRKPNKLTQLVNPMTDGNENLRLEETLEDEEGNPMISRRIVVDQNEKPIFEVRSFDPTGFWRIFAKKGKLPEELSGLYTSQMRAQRDIEAYLRNKK